MPERGPAKDAGRPAALIRLAAAGASIDYAEAETLAGQGLNEEQVLAVLGVEGELNAEAEARLEASMRKGRALGAARIRKAQYEAALKGSVTAQSQLLKALQEDEDGGEVRVTVESMVVGEEGTEIAPQD